MRVVFAGGGTGGHLFPGIALAEELRARGGHQCLFVGTAKGIETRVVPSEGWPLELIDIGALKGGGVGGVARGLVRVPRAIVQSLAILGRFKPDLVVGVGGYASGPLVLAAALTGHRTAILEQNSVPGITNRILGRVVGTVFVAFEESRRYFPAHKVRLEGNPIRAKMREGVGAASQHVFVAMRDQRLLVCGGSQGAHAVNERVVEAMALLATENRAPRLVHQTGAADRFAVAERYRAAGLDAAHAEVREFIDDMATAYRDADLVVGRAGATTIAELTAIGRASILIPFPRAADDHQTVNALALAHAGAAKVFPESGLSARTLADTIASLLSDDEQRSRMADAARRIGRPNAARAITDALLEIASR